MDESTAVELVALRLDNKKLQQKNEWLGLLVRACARGFRIVPTKCFEGWELWKYGEVITLWAGYKDVLADVPASIVEAVRKALEDQSND